MAARQERLLAAKDVSVRHKFADKAYNNVRRPMIFVVPLYSIIIIHLNEIDPTLFS